jgi:hypothetical protein
MAHGTHAARQAEKGQLDHGRPCKRAALVAGSIGLVTVIAGTAHLVGVVAAAVHRHKPFNFRLVSLIAIGGMLLYAGLLNLGVSRWLRRGRQWAFAMSTFGTIALLAYAILLLFMKTPLDPTDPFAGASSTALGLVTMESICLAFLLAGWSSLRRRQRA